MKKNIFLFLCLLAYSLIGMSSCDNDRETTISTIHENDVPTNVELMEYTNTSITVAWDFVEGATSYTVQLLSNVDSDYPQHMYTTSTDDYYEFTGLSPRGNYYARVRANFPYSATSKWVYVMNEDEYARIMPAYGIVNGDFEIVEVQLIAKSSSTLTVGWSFTDFLDMASEINNTFSLELFNDEACEDLYISWEDIKGLFSASLLRFTFTGLEPGKDYYARVTDATANTQTRAYKLTTDVAAPAVGGNVILSQDFSNFIHGGDQLYTAAGYTVGTAAGRATWEKAAGKNPVDATKGQAACAVSTEFNVFDGGNVTVAYTEGAGMKDWGKNGNTSTRPGYIKIGGGSAGATLYTPQLSSLSETSTVTVSFKAAIYKEGSTGYCEDIVIQVVDGAEFNAKGGITNFSSVTVREEKKISILEADSDFESYEVTLTNVTPESRIAFSSDYTRTGDNKTRFFLDNIVIRNGAN